MKEERLTPTLIKDSETDKEGKEIVCWVFCTLYCCNTAGLAMLCKNPVLDRKKKKTFIIYLQIDLKEKAFTNNRLTSKRKHLLITC